jgi:uncharacterized protein (DUF2062 family)
MAGRLAGWQTCCRQRLVAPLRSLLAGGLAPRSLAWALAVGALLGSMPLVWGTSLLCFGVALLLRLNPLAAQVGNLAAWPLQLLLAYPCVRLGSYWFGPGVSVESGEATLLQSLIQVNGAALGVWALASPLLLSLFYAVSRWVVTAVRRSENP